MAFFLVPEHMDTADASFISRSRIRRGPGPLVDALLRIAECDDVQDRQGGFVRKFR